MGSMNDLSAIRERLGWTQQQMAASLDIGLRTYVDAESSDQPRKAYILAAKYLASQDPAYGFDSAVVMPDPAAEARSQTCAAMYVARAALEVALRCSTNPTEGFNLSAFLWDESNAADVEPVARRGAFLAGEVVHAMAKEENDQRTRRT